MVVYSTKYSFDKRYVPKCTILYSKLGEGEKVVSPTILISNKSERNFEMLNYTWRNDRFQYDMLSVTGYLG